MIFRTAVYATRTYGGVRGAPHRLQAVRPSTRLNRTLVPRETIEWGILCKLGSKF